MSVERCYIQARIDCVPVPASRPRVTARGTYMPRRHEAGARAQAAQLARYTPRNPLEGPVALLLTYYMPMPKRAKRVDGDGSGHASRPDLDNLIKLTKDVMTRLGYWRDDAQVWRVVAEKRWSSRPGVLVEVVAA